ncbi:MAG: tRNA modification GTPase [Candidatus Phytoplasma cynodontis]|uniref:tRNA uridine-5-carboxymethylaminomethyl(34) synthesis GTPase MnmE n=1 Tax='Cynodon dactylon' phytoplasma TaxID=295320 RepID=UPI001265D6E4|nr:tRNA uridine-5-carboxymethylaminomethyl(34) synthesis GTPase MnmE ['Cynodon dactylon' phytoplasma]KAB8121721.1 tRNA uridine-5-carboxymethylaminomethyl(34) synthesis GTPase MnmE ['Cynodon dactylon' phytoplasma]WIA07695.1 MAG: tRNA modification GTPase [Candidatus Phytoplasma cynodontis]
MFESDTIAAIATPLGTGSISIIRVSGDQSISKINTIFKHAKKNVNLSKVPSHTIHHGFILDQDKKVLDEVLISVFKKPNSFTGENVVEINCHGGILLTQILLERVLSLNIRLAQPGEFSKRSFLNGKIDLIQAESIMDLIHAQSKNAIRLANLGISKETSKLVNSLKQKILTLIGKIEVNIDYPEYDDAQTMTNEIILPILKKIIKKMKKILHFSSKMRLLKSGIKTLIIGKPNVGKSSLLNILLNEERAIVSNIPGTTRDFVNAFIDIQGISLMLIDTAGIRKTKDPLEKIGIFKSKKILKEAELVLLLLDNSKILDNEDKYLLELTKNYPRIIVISKTDLPNKLDFSIIKDKIVFISNINKNGIDILKKEIINFFNLNYIKEKDFNYFSNIRHIQQIKIALNSLENIELDIQKRIPIDIHTINLKIAFNSLNEIIGNEINNDLLINELFSKFCLGK